VGIGGGRVRRRLLGSRSGTGRGRGRASRGATRGGRGGTALLARHFDMCEGVFVRVTGVWYLEFLQEGRGRN
jgi:hypothetical protein